MSVKRTEFEVAEFFGWATHNSTNSSFFKDALLNRSQYHFDIFNA